MAEETKRNLRKIFILTDYKMRIYFNTMIQKLMHKLHFIICIICPWISSLVIKLIVDESFLCIETFKIRKQNYFLGKRVTGFQSISGDCQMFYPELYFLL